jgi:hypothetical protein
MSQQIYERKEWVEKSSYCTQLIITIAFNSLMERNELASKKI